MDKHHIYGASSLARRMACPGSAKIEAGMPEQTSTDADEGRMLHQSVADALAGKASEWLTSEQQESVDTCVEYARSLGGVGETELTVEIIGSGFSAILFSTLDYATQADELHVCEWKFGRSPVAAAAENIQGATYALGAMQRFGADKCTVHLLQPRLSKRPSVHTYTNQAALLGTVEGIIERCEQDSAPLIAGEEQCRYCRGKGICPAFRQYSEAPLLTARSETLAPVENWQDDELGEFRRRCGLLEKLKAQVDSELRRRIGQAGKVVGGYTLTKPRKTRQIEDVAQAYTCLQGLLDAVEFAGACKIGWTALVDKVAAKHQIKGTEAGKRIEAALGEIMKWTEGEPSLKSAAEKEGAE